MLPSTISGIQSGPHVRPEVCSFSHIVGQPTGGISFSTCKLVREREKEGGWKASFSDCQGLLDLALITASKEFPTFSRWQRDHKVGIWLQPELPKASLERTFPGKL